MKNTRIYLLLPLFLMAAMAVFAQQKQKFSVVSFEELPLDMTAREDGAKDDGTGSLYAIIKVTSTNPDDDLRAYNFDFNYLKHVVEAKDGELWVYVQRNAKRVNISREGFHPLRNYDLRTTIQAGKVYSMQLTSEVQKIYRQFLVFEVLPTNSEAIITYKNVESRGEYKPFSKGVVDSNGKAAMSLELGTYVYKIISDKYHSTEGRVVLKTPNGKHVETVTLSPNFANVTLTTEDGVEIYINDERKGVGTWKGTLSPGTYSVECRKTYHKSYYETITVEEGRDITMKLSPPTPITGVLSLVSDPLGANIVIDGESYGETPCFVDTLLIGRHKVVILLSGYKNDTIDVDIRDGEMVEHSITLVKQGVKDQMAHNLSDVYGEHEYVDLALPSGVKWATCNVGAMVPEGFGDYYAWGEIQTKNVYNKKSCVTRSIYLNDISGNAKYDVARSKWGGEWRMPTKDDFQELAAHCIWVWGTKNGVKGYKVTSIRNGNSIFLPAAGYRRGKSFYNVVPKCFYWCSTPKNIVEAYVEFLHKDNRSIQSLDRSDGLTVRPVCD